jgi:hypothetical protein
MDEIEAARLHESLDFVGLRAHATAVGLIQLTAELVRAGVLQDEAVARIKAAIIRDIVLTRPRSISREEFERSIRERVDRLFTGHETLGAEPAPLAE